MTWSVRSRAQNSIRLTLPPEPPAKSKASTDIPHELQAPRVPLLVPSHLKSRPTAPGEGALEKRWDGESRPLPPHSSGSPTTTPISLAWHHDCSQEPAWLTSIHTLHPLHHLIHLSLPHSKNVFQLIHLLQKKQAVGTENMFHAG